MAEVGPDRDPKPRMVGRSCACRRGEPPCRHTILLSRVAPRIVRIYTLRGFESVLAGSVQVSTGTKTSLSFQDGPVFTRVHRREGPAAPRGSRARTHGTTISQPTWPGVPDRLHPAHGAGAGQRYLFPRKTLKATYSHRLGDYALEFYTFVADNYAPFYSTPIECTERDAAYVLDGLLYHESEIDPEEHYTDTHGYTELNFAAFAMFGKRFCPRRPRSGFRPGC